MTTATPTSSWVVGENPEPQHTKSQVWNFPIPFTHTKKNINVLVNGTRTDAYQYSVGVVTFSRSALQDGDVVTIARHTQPEAADPTTDKLPEYNPGNSIKADDLNEANSILVKRLEELEALVKSQAYLGDNPPDSSIAWRGMAWVNTNTWRVAVFNGTRWIETSPQ